MPPKRDPSQTIMTVSLPTKLLSLVDQARIRNLKGVARAQFVREALAEKMAAMGIVVPPDFLSVPDRVNVALNERPPKPEPEPLQNPPEKVIYPNKRAAKKKP